MHTPEADLGIVLRPEIDVESLAAGARRAEAAGFAEVWLWEDCFLAGGIATSAIALTATTHITVGVGILPVPARNAAFTAMEIATLAQLYPGRFHPGLGHGIDEWMRQVGAKPASQLALLEETVAAVRALLAGETVTSEGRYVRLRGVALDRVPGTAPPISVGVRGPKSLFLSGRIADGTVLDSLSSPAYVEWARERIDAGRRNAEREDVHRLTVYAYCATHAGAEEALRHAVDERRAKADARLDFLNAPLTDLALVGDQDEQKRALAALRSAGADCVVLVSPDPRVPLDPDALAHLFD